MGVIGLGRLGGAGAFGAGDAGLSCPTDYLDSRRGVGGGGGVPVLVTGTIGLGRDGG